MASTLGHCVVAREARASEIEAAKSDVRSIEELENRIARWAASDEIVGAELLIFEGDQMIASRAFGWQNREVGAKLEVGAIYRVNAMTKPVIGTAVLLLSDDGSLHLDDPVSSYLKSFDTEALRSITIRQLLSNRSGLGGSTGSDSRLPKGFNAYPDLATLVEAIAAIPRDSLDHRFQYSNNNTAVLGHLVAQVSGISLEQFIAHRIFEPLGMIDSHTRFSPQAPWADKVVSTYALQPESCKHERVWSPADVQSAPYFRPSGGLYTTAHDYSRFLSMWLNEGRFDGQQFLKEATVKEALQPIGDRLIYNEGSAFGLHWTIYDPNSAQGMPSIFGQGGSNGTLAIAFPRTGKLVLYFSQSRNIYNRARFYQELGETEGFHEIRSIWAGEIRDAWREAIEAGRVPDEKLAMELVGNYSMGQHSSLRLEWRDDTLTFVTHRGDKGRFFTSPEGDLLTGNCEASIRRLSIERSDDGKIFALNGKMENGASFRLLRSD
ncbi:beta-lactamase family protein [Qipengyuania sp. 1XM1-15A]|uniref:serine hydrolase domain-containing protein n=1 Tax=Qipengyuania xiamenensis TaxID=2867237 RepID=UPI001C88221E|nr:beta-lactamase family protein [Qipengyuania xiamenensis]